MYLPDKSSVPAKLPDLRPSPSFTKSSIGRVWCFPALAQTSLIGQCHRNHHVTCGNWALLSNIGMTVGTVAVTCTASAGDWQITTTTSHRSANQRYFMHNSATVHRMRMQSSALDSSRSQLCNDTSTGVVRHQITKWRRLQKVVSYDVLHHRWDAVFLNFWIHFKAAVSR